MEVKYPVSGWKCARPSSRRHEQERPPVLDEPVEPKEPHARRSRPTRPLPLSIVALGCFSFLLIMLAAVQAFGQLLVQPHAQMALGQQNLVYNILNQTGPATLFYPTDISRDSSVVNTRFYVADAFNSRVLGFDCQGSGCALPTTTAAVRVFGQPDFVHWQADAGVGGAVRATTLAYPRGVAVGPSGELFVADTDNNRVLVYLEPWTDSTGDIVLGQSTMSTNSPGSGLNQLRSPEAVYSDPSGALWVADTGNNRVLRFTNLTNGAFADLVVGGTGTGSPSATTTSGPRGITMDGQGWLYVADTNYSRVLAFAPPIGNGAAASLVFGQAGSFRNGSPNLGGVSAASLAYPEKVQVDPSGRLWISDTLNNRVLEFDAPLSSQTAARAFGQASRQQVPSFATAGYDAPDGFPNAAGMHGPRGLAFDSLGGLWVCDRDNSRVLGFDAPLASPPGSLIADRVLGKKVFVDTAANGPTAQRLNNPMGVAVDLSHTPNRLWVSDIGNNRVLGYSSTATLTTNAPAEIVLGQPSFTNSATNAGLNGPLQNAATAVASSSSFFFPVGVAVDSRGGVYVADASNNRILEFEDPFGTDVAADQVFGHPNFTDLNPNFPYGSASSLAGPHGVSLDAYDDLWVADTAYNRVVRFSNARGQPRTGASADLLLGQVSFKEWNYGPPATYAPGCAANLMNAPRGIHAARSGRLYVADTGNHRVLVFAPPFANEMNAVAVFGQASFNSCMRNRGGQANADTLNEPRGILEDDAGNVYIADYRNNRVLVYLAPFEGGDFLADEVIGQPNFTSTAVESPAPDTLFSPFALAQDAQQRFFIADGENSRVTRYVTQSGPSVHLDAIPSPIVVGEFTTFTGSGFTAGSVIKLYVATANGPQAFGPFPVANWNSGYLIWHVDPFIPLGNGFVTLQVINTDQGFIQSNYQSQLLFGNQTFNVPTILKVNGFDIPPANPSVPVAYVGTNIQQGSTVTLTGAGFNNPLVNLFTATGLVGPLTPLPGGSSTQIQVHIPPTTPTGPGSFQVVNSPYTLKSLSNAVSVPIGPKIDITSITQQGSTVTVHGNGFCVLTVINLFNQQGSGAPNIAGLNPDGSPRIPLTFVSETEFTFTVPKGAASGPAFLQALNPPFLSFSATGNDPDGGFLIIAP